MKTRLRGALVRILWLIQARGAAPAGRCVDVLVAGLLAATAAPWLAARGLWALASTGRVFDSQTCVGVGHRLFRRLRFAGPARGRGLATLLNILRGDLALAGPGALVPAAAAAVPMRDRVRFSVRPGLVSSYSLQRALGIAYGDESASARKFVLEQTLTRDLAVVVRSVPALLLGGGGRHQASRYLRVLGVRVDNLTMDETLARVVGAARKGETLRAAFVNTDCLNQSVGSDEYRRNLDGADLVLADGIGIRLAGRILGTGVRANVNGTDLFPMLCERAVREGLSIFLLGARPGVAEAVADTMQKSMPRLKIAGFRDGYWSREQEDEIVAEVAASRADILLVALGAPRQDLWIARHHDRLRVPVALGVGGLFDFYSGRIPRAPLWLRELGLEWIWRLFQEPGRMWRRYVIGNPLFLIRVLRQRLDGSSRRRAFSTEPCTTEPDAFQENPR
jgi:N-acetylglucosaminyldiphosphoundecaprenol N-acetyl-beta-D-mannosaminyltransferase